MRYSPIDRNEGTYCYEYCSRRLSRLVSDVHLARLTIDIDWVENMWVITKDETAQERCMDEQHVWQSDDFRRRQQQPNFR